MVLFTFLKILIEFFRDFKIQGKVYLAFVL